MEIIDVHAHAFPDSLANKALAGLQSAYAPYKPFTDGTVGGLLGSMDEAGIKAAFLLNIATAPQQAAGIRKWARAVASDRIIPVGSIHPDSPEWQKDIDAFREDGFCGIKFQPMYQKFSIDDARMFPVYEYIAVKKMFVIFHSGEDLAFPGNTQASVERIAAVLKRAPDLKVIASHFGGWRSWGAALDQLCGKDVYFDTSFINEVDPSLRRKILSRHDRQYFLFGTDSPWLSQKGQVEFVKTLPDVDDGFKEGVFSGNIKRLLSSLREK